MSKRILSVFIAIFLTCSISVACSPKTANLPASVVKGQPLTTQSPTETPPEIEPTLTRTAQITLTNTAAPSMPSETPVPSLTPTPSWIYHESGQIIAPILLYHQIGGETYESRYKVSVPDFRLQMQTLHEMGYTAIPISVLLDVLINGGDLPDKPIVITFDDGHESVYENAFPIMQSFHYPGVFYIVANRIYDTKDFVNVEILKEMVAAGWEIGSHGYTHSNLTFDHSSVNHEIAYSRLDLQDALSVEIQTFAYPYGAVDPFLSEKVADYGYRAGMGLGTSNQHSLNSLYYLNRREVQGDFSLEDFLNLLQSK